MAPIWNRPAYDRGRLLSEEHCPGVLPARRAHRYTGTVGPLNRWVDELRRATGEQVPYFDPAAARDGAHVLVLLQDPSAEAGTGSGFVSRHNNDPTARNLSVAAERAGLSYDVSLVWNVVPWWVADRRSAARRAPVGRRPPRRSARGPTSRTCSGSSIPPRGPWSSPAGTPRGRGRTSSGTAFRSRCGPQRSCTARTPARRPSRWSTAPPGR